MVGQGPGPDCGEISQLDVSTPPVTTHRPAAAHARARNKYVSRGHRLTISPAHTAPSISPNGRVIKHKTLSTFTPSKVCSRGASINHPDTEGRRRNVNYKTDAGLLINNKQTWTMYGFLSSWKIVFQYLHQNIDFKKLFLANIAVFTIFKTFSYVLEYLAFLVPRFIVKVFQLHFQLLCFLLLNYIWRHKCH